MQLLSEPIMLSRKTRPGSFAAMSVPPSTTVFDTKERLVRFHMPGAVRASTVISDPWHGGATHPRMKMVSTTTFETPQGCPDGKIRARSVQLSKRFVVTALFEWP